MARILGKPKPPQEPGTVGTSKLKKVPGKTKPETQTIKRGKTESAQPPAEPNPKPAEK